jgi:histidinol phosphatase-like enzyme
MLDSLIAQWSPDLSASFMLGDSDKDVTAGTLAGLVSKKVEPATLLHEVELQIARHQNTANSLPA